MASTTAAPTATRPALPSPRVRSQGIALRRGIVLVLMSCFLPGSAQVAAGRRRVGRAVLRFLVIMVVVIVVLALLSLIPPVRGFLIGLVANSITLRVLQWAVLVWAVVWILLLADAWRLARPAMMSRLGMVLSGLLAVLLALGGGTAAWSVSSRIGAAAGLSANVFVGGGTSQVQNGRYNVLLLGGDAGADRTGLRPDSMTVASIDAATGRTVLFSLPRNLQKAPFPTDSPLHKLYPNGYYCPEKSLADRCLLNGIYTLANEHKDLFPGVKYPGVEATRSSIEEILGLKINYWAMIDLNGFRELINALGGITLDVGTRVPIGSKDGPKGVYGYIEPGKNQHLMGFKALWFARSREGSTDYQRMIRQKCVMNAMLKQLNPTNVMTKFTDIAKAGEQIVATNLPVSDIGTMTELAMKAKTLPMSSVSFAPPLIVTYDPNFAKIRTTVTNAIAASEALDSGQATASPSASSSATTGSSTSSKPYTGTKTDNLDSICHVS